jgi:hypothetical protein
MPSTVDLPRAGDRAPAKLVYCLRGGQETLNFGEWFCEWILAALGFRIRYWETEARARRLKPDDACLLMIGSEADRYLVDRLLAKVREVHLWGMGLGRGPELALDFRAQPYRDRVKVFALRGPVTKRLSHFEGDVPLCDPAFALPKLLPQFHYQAPPCGPVLYVPHLANIRSFSVQRAAAIGVDHVCPVTLHRSELAGFLTTLGSADFVLTNTLHTWIWCMAFEIPCAICLTGNERLPMPTKWRDVFESMGLSPAEPLPIVRDLAEGRAWWETGRRLLKLPDADAMLAAFPR